MSTPSDKTLSGAVLDNSCSFTLHELCTVCSVQQEYIFELVDEGILEPVIASQDQEQWCFPGDTLLRVKKVYRLQRDLDVNLAGAALALELMNEVDSLRQQLRFLKTDI